METTNTTASEAAAREQAIEAMRYNGNGPECLPHLACGGIGCGDCSGGAVKCGCCVHRVAVTTVADGTPEGMDVCGWCADEAKAADARAANWAALDREWLAAGAEIRAERARGAA
jgi:hypothetical protein